MEKIKIETPIDCDLKWHGMTSIDLIRQDINDLKRIGITHVRIETHGLNALTNFSYTTIVPFIIREESDEEFTERKEKHEKQ